MILVLLPVLVIVIGAIGMCAALAVEDAKQLRDDPRGGVQRRRRLRRRRAIGAAATDAAIDDPELDASAIEAAAHELVIEYHDAAYALDEERIRALAAAKQGERWVSALHRFSRPGHRRTLERVERLEATLVGLENRHDRVRATLYIDGALLVPGYWTLERVENRWRVLAARDEREGRHLLERDVIAVPWADDELALHAELELAWVGAGPPGAPLPAPPGVTLDEQAAAQLRDLSVVDVRADPATLERVARRMLDAWVEAVAGDETVLRELATPEVVDGLLARDDRLGTERAVRELHVRRLEVSSAAMSATPPRVRIGARVSAYWYRRIIGTDYGEWLLWDEGRNGATEDPGDPYRPAELDLTLTLTMDGVGRWPWRLVAVEIRPRRR